MEEEARERAMMKAEEKQREEERRAGAYGRGGEGEGNDEGRGETEGRGEESRRKAEEGRSPAKARGRGSKASKETRGGDPYCSEAGAGGTTESTTKTDGCRQEWSGCWPLFSSGHSQGR